MSYSNMGFKALIVDDEIDARDGLEILLSKIAPDVQVCGKAQNVIDAVKLIKTLQPDVVFLDVEMPQHSGYELVTFFEAITFKIVFVTAHDKYAINAFEINAIDYLLKPVNRKKLISTINKISAEIASEDKLDKYTKLLNDITPPNEGKLIVHELGKKVLIDIKNILALEAMGAYSKIHFSNDDKALIVSKNLRYLENALPQINPFFRSHKSWLININHITSYKKTSREIILSNTLIAKLSRQKKYLFDERLNIK